MRSDHIVYLIAVLAILIMGSVLILPILYPSGILPSNQATLMVSASGSSSLAPQAGTVTLYINATGITAALATSNLGTTLAQVNNTLIQYTNASSINTQSYSLWKAYNSSLYRASEYVSVNLNSASSITPLLQALAVYNNVFVSGASAQLSTAQRIAATNTALQLAMQNATAQAKALTNNATLKVTGVTVSSGIFYPVGINNYASAAVSASPLFFSGKQSLTETVQVTFAYTPT